MSFRHLTVAEGLSQNTVMDILQDTHGYVWLATENGLDRYDGYRVHRYQRGQSGAGELINDYIWKIAEDAASNLWLATDGKGVALWNRATDRFEHFQHDPDDPASLSSDRTRTLLLSGSSLWIGTQNAGLNRLEPQTGRVIRYRHNASDPGSLPSDAVYGLLEDGAGGLWVGTDNGLAWLGPGADRFVRYQHDPGDPHSLSSNRIRALHRDRRGGLWIGTYGGGLNLLDNHTGRVIRFGTSPGSPDGLSNDHVRAIYEDDVGRLWIGTAEGLNVLLPNDDRFWSYHAGERNYELSDGYIMSLYQDRGGVLWVGTRTGGVNTWNSRSWDFGHYRTEWLRSKSVTAFASDARGFWIGTFGDGLSRIEKPPVRTAHLNSQSRPALSDDRVMSLMYDSSGGLWVGTMEGGVNWLRPGTDTFTVLRHDPDDPNTLSADGAMSLFEDSSGSIWIGTFGGGVTRYDPAAGRFQRFEHAPDDPASLCGTQGRAFAEDRAGAIWIGTERGLCMLDRRTGSFRAFLSDPTDARSLAADAIYALHVDPDGRLWIGTGGGGLSQMIGSSSMPGQVSFRTFSRRDGLSSNMVYGIHSDRSGRIWLSGNNGLTRLDPSTGDVHNYRRTHGLQGDEFHYGASHRSSDGRLFFGGSNGFNVFDPERLSQPANPPRVVLTGVKKMNRLIDSGGPLTALRELHLDHRETALTFEFAALDFTDPGSNRYSYRLAGFEDRWIDADTRRTATYTNLDAGDYVFQVRGAGSVGPWNHDGVSLRVSVAPAPWQTVWAYAAYALLAGGLLVRYATSQHRKLARESEYRRRLQREVRQRTDELEQSNHQLKRLSQAKSEFLARMSHELRSPMNGVLGMAELLSRTELTERQRKFSDTIVSSGQSLLHIINDILDHSKLDANKLTLDPTDVDLERMIDETLEMFALDARRRGLELVALLPPHGIPTVRIDGMRLRQVLINLLNNALKFTEQGSVRLTATLVAATAGRIRLRLATSDTGIGIAAENQARIFDSFSQEDGSTSRRFGGTGLGLTISRDLVELMGGTLELRSTPGRGSEFFFELELDRAEPDSGCEPMQTLQGQVLVAAPGDAQRTQLETYLRAWGLHVQSAPTAAAAFDAVTSPAGRSLSCLIADTHLGDDSGSRLVERLSARGLLQAARAIVLEAPGDQQVHASPQEWQHLGKPVRRRELHQLLMALTDAGGSRAETGATTSATDVQLTGRVLLVEDSPVNQEVLTGMLAELGCPVEFATYGLAGVEMALTGRFDLVLMDLQLPDIDGDEATRRIRSLQRNCGHLPIIALTANASPDDRARCEESGMDAFLAKPCTIQQLAQVLERWLPLEARVVPAAARAAPAVAEQYDEAILADLRRMRRADGSDLLAHAAGLFTRSAEEALVAIAQGIESQNAERVRFAAHKLKSGCANLGAVGMAKTCRELEELTRRQSLQGAAAIVGRLRAQYTDVVRWLEDQINATA